MKTRATLPLLLLVLCPALAHAAGTSKAAVAEGLFQQAKKLLNAGEVSAACEKFRASLEVDRASGTLTALAFCHQREGRTASAWAEYNEVAAEAKRDGKKEQESYARGQIAALEKVLRKVTVVTQAVPGLVVKIDGVELPSGARGDVPVDPGTRAFEASAPDHAAATKAVELPPGPGTTVVELPPLAPLVAARRPPVPAPAREPARSKDDRVLLGGGIAVAGIAAVGVGAYLQFVVARRQQDDSTFLMRQALDAPGATSKHDDAVVSSALGLGAIALGLAAVGFGGYLLVTPYASASGGGVALGGKL